MKKILFKYLFASIIITFVNASFAFTAAGTDNNCNNTAGTWTGSGSVQLFILSCGYDATVQVSEGNPANASLSVTKTSGSFFCPSTLSREVTAKCEGGTVTIKDDVVDVEGRLNEDNTKLDLNGTIYALFKKHPVSISLTKN